MSRHRLVQRHEPSGRMNLYIASHVHHIEGLPAAESRALIVRLYAHACQPKYVVAIDVSDHLCPLLAADCSSAAGPADITFGQWTDVSDLILWDNTCVMHRATGGSFEGKYVRDMRRATVHDSSPHAWGLNPPSSARMGFP